MALSNQEVRDRGSRRSPQAESWRSFRRYNARPAFISPRSTVGHSQKNGGNSHPCTVSANPVWSANSGLDVIRKKTKSTKRRWGFPKVSRFKCLHRNVKERTENGTVFGRFFFVSVTFCPCGVSYVSAMCRKSSNGASKISQAPLSLKIKKKQSKTPKEKPTK